MRKWRWFSVKVITERVVSGEPAPDTVDQNYTNEYRIFEESILLIRAQSFDHAYKIAEKKARAMDLTYENPYEQTVSQQLIGAIDCFDICEETVFSGTELYWRAIWVPKTMDQESFIDTYYPDTIRNDSGPEHAYILRNREFNRRPNS